MPEQFHPQPCNECGGRSTLGIGSFACSVCGGTGWIVIDVVNATYRPVKRAEADDER